MVSPAPAMPVESAAVVSGREVLLVFADRRWRVRGLDKASSFDLLRVNVAAPAAGGLRSPADAYTVLGSLSPLASRLPQALSQLDGFLAREVDTGRITITAGEPAGDPVAAITTTALWLDRATDAADALRRALDQAQAALACAASTDPTYPLN